MSQWSSLLTRCFGLPPAEQHPAPARCSEPQLAPAKALGHACGKSTFPTAASSLTPAASTTAHWEVSACACGAARLLDSHMFAMNLRLQPLSFCPSVRHVACVQDALVNLTAAAEAELDARKHQLLQLAPVLAAEVEAEVAAANSQRGSSVPELASPKTYKVKLQGQPAATSGLNNSHSYMRRCSDFMMAVQAVQQSAVLRSMQKSQDEQLQPPADKARYRSMLHTAGQTQQLAQQQRQHPRLAETAPAASLFYGSLDGPHVRRQATSNTCNSSDNSNRTASGLIVNDATHRGAMYVATWQRGLTARRAERWAALTRGAADGNALATLTVAYASAPSGPACKAWAGLRSGSTSLTSPFEQQQQLSQLAVAGDERLYTVCQSAPRVRPALATPNITPPTSCEDAEFLELLNARTANKQSV